MPDRDYYVKPDARFKEAREKYVAHVANMFRLAGDSEADRATRMPRRVVRDGEHGWPRHRSTTSRCAIPRRPITRCRSRELQRLAPAFNWAAYYKAAGIAAGALNVAEPKFLQAFSRDLTAEPVAQWKMYLKWHLLNSAAPSLSDDFVKEDFAFNGAYLNGATEMKPRWKRCVELTDSLLGEALGKKYVEKYFPPEAKARMQEMVKNLLPAMGETIQGLDWMSAETKQRARSRSCRPSIRRSAIRTAGRTTARSRSAATSFWEDVVAGRAFNVRDDLLARSASRSIAAAGA